MNRFILADTEKCIGCRTCEVACVVSHQGMLSAGAFAPRIRVVKGGAFTTAVGCHQCEDAPCALFVRHRRFATPRVPGGWSRRAVLAVKLCGSVPVWGDAGSASGEPRSGGEM